MNPPSVVYDLSAKRLLHQATDETLVAAAKAGENLAFIELCNRYAKRAFRTVYRVTRNQEDAEDALQEALFSAFLHLRSFDGRSKFSTWLTRIAINSALMTLRKRRARPQVSLDSYMDDEARKTWEMPDQSTDIEFRYLQFERESLLKQAIHNLRPALRGVIEIQRLHEGSVKEIAETAGISVPATKSRLIRARAVLRRSLGDYGTSEAKSADYSATTRNRGKQRPVDGH